MKPYQIQFANFKPNNRMPTPPTTELLKYIHLDTRVINVIIGNSIRGKLSSELPLNLITQVLNITSKV